MRHFRSPALAPSGLALVAIALLSFFGCDRPAPAPAPAPAQPTATTPAPAAPAPSREAPSIETSRYEAPSTVVAVGDVHGDLDALKRVLTAAKLIDADGRWIGGDSVLVQTGDLLDRGDDEQAIVDLLHDLRQQAREAGGRVVLLVGNHEAMNVAGDLRYVTAGGFEDFADAPGVADALASGAEALSTVPAPARARVAAFRPGGPYAQMLADHDVVAIVGDTLFAHGGVLPAHVRFGLDRLNTGTRAWMRGEAPAPPGPMMAEDAPVWTRQYSGDAVDPASCQQLARTLEAVGARRLVVGHTPQRQGITRACEGRVWRIDTGMSAHYGGPAQALRIDGEVLEVLDAP